MTTALLSSDFIHIGYNFYSHIYLDKKVNILLCTENNSDFYRKEVIKALNKAFSINRIITPKSAQDLPTDIDVVFIGGQNPFKLHAELLKTGIFEKIRNYINNGCVFIGDDAGAIIAGNFEPHHLFLNNEEDAELVNTIGKNKFIGFRLTNIYIQPHASKYYLKTIEGETINKIIRLPYPKINGETRYVAYLNDYLKVRRLNILSSQLKNNQVMIIKNNISTIYDFDWSCFPFEKNSKL